MVTQKQRNAYRFALEDKGVPEVIAYMASLNSVEGYSKYNLLNESADSLIAGAFFWNNSAEGQDFWAAIDRECQERCR